MDRGDDPLGLKGQATINVLLNVRSTGVIARIGKVAVNTMIHADPGNLKLIGRATYLIMSLVNDPLPGKGITYYEAWPHFHFLDQ